MDAVFPIAFIAARPFCVYLKMLSSLNIHIGVSVGIPKQFSKLLLSLLTLRLRVGIAY
jgi:hypothetical protein